MKKALVARAFNFLQGKLLAQYRFCQYRNFIVKHFYHTTVHFPVFFTFSGFQYNFATVQGTDQCSVVIQNLKGSIRSWKSSRNRFAREDQMVRSDNIYLHDKFRINNEKAPPLEEEGLVYVLFGFGQ